jgi:hypothetical protein
MLEEVYMKVRMIGRARATRNITKGASVLLGVIMGGLIAQGALVFGLDPKTATIIAAFIADIMAGYAVE